MTTTNPATITNRIDMPTAVHWHGIRLDNRFDGVPHLTQDAVPPGGTFTYVVRFPDAGIYVSVVPGRLARGSNRFRPRWHL